MYSTCCRLSVVTVCTDGRTLFFLETSQEKRVEAKKIRYMLSKAQALDLPRAFVTAKDHGSFRHNASYLSLLRIAISTDWVE